MHLILMWLLLSVGQIADWDVMAQQAYHAGNYQEAITYYEMGMAEGRQSAQLYYNLGNSYFELGDLGHAMLYYLRAHGFSPRDEAIQASMERVRALRRDYQQESQDWGDYLTDVTASFLRIDEMMWLAVMAWGYGCLMISYCLIRQKMRQHKWFLVINITLIGLIMLLSAVRWNSVYYRPKAVIIAPIVDVMSGASQDYLSLYNLYAGAEVRIIERQGGWARLLLPDGSSGWINRFDFEYVNPQ